MWGGRSWTASDSVTLKLRLGRVAGLCPVDQADQTGKSIPGRGNRYTKVTLVNRKVPHVEGL